MIAQSILETTALRSEIGESSLIKPKGGKFKRSLAADLLLTALIDAFSILVIYLLMSFSSTGEILQMSKDMEMPKASLADTIERNTVIKIDQHQVFLEDKATTADGLVAELLEIRKNFGVLHKNEEFQGIITVQADRRTQYTELNKVVLAAAHAGFSDIRFAVLMK
jgi:biopolymer transport protein ExbD